MDDQYANPGKVFVGGLGQGTTTFSLRNFFAQFGNVVDAAVVSDKVTGRSRGFGFCIFEDAASSERCLNGRHKIDGVSCEVRRAIPRDDMRESAPYDTVEQAGKLFVGGLPEDVTEDALKEYFEKFGPVRQATLMYDKNYHRPRGFGFIIYDNPADSLKAGGDHPTLGRACSAKKAEPRLNPRRSQRGGGGGGRFEQQRYPYGDNRGGDGGGWWNDDRRNPMGSREYGMGRGRMSDMRGRGGYGPPSPYGSRDGYGQPYGDPYGDYGDMPYGGSYGGYGGMYGGYDQQGPPQPSSNAAMYQGYGKDSYSQGGSRYRGSQSYGQDGMSHQMGGYSGGHMGSGSGFGPQRTGGQFGPAVVRAAPY